MFSMTGYAYTEENFEDYSIVVEIKSVNSRFIDLSINLPLYLGRLENKFKQLITSKLRRGKIDVFIRVKEKNTPVNIDVNLEASKAYYEALKKIAFSIGKKEEDIPLSLIISQEGVLSSQKEIDIDKYYSMILPVLNNSLEQIDIEKNREGENLKKDILKQLQKVEDAYNVFVQWQPKMEQLFKENITKKFEEVCGDKIDEQRIMTETASLLVKYTINEEIVRLHSHLLAIKSELETNLTPGKKIDFICQEMNREINTIGSKNQILEIGQYVILAKDAVENIREQSKNIE